MARKKNRRQVELKPMPVTRKENESGEEKYPLAKVIKKLPTRLDDTLIPNVYTHPKEEAVVIRARQEFYSSEEVSQSYCQVLESYKGTEAAAEEGPEPKQDPEQDLPETKKENQITKLPKHELQTLLHRSALAEHRKEMGLDKLRDIIKNKIVESCSFKRGLEMIVDLIKSKKQKDSFEWLGRQDTLKPLLDETLPYEDTVAAVSEVYPDLTADEVAWLSLAGSIRNGWIFDRIAPFYYPPALVSMSIDGFDCAFGTIDDKFDDNFKEATAFKIGGITGIDTQTLHIPFDHNLAQAIKALVILETEDQDIFRGLWKNEDILAVKRGDAMLVKALLEKQKEKYRLEGVDLSKTYLQRLLDDKSFSFGRDDLEAIRGQINKYYCENNFRNRYLHNVCDFVKLMGLLKNVPKFIKEQKPFDGHVMFYGGNVEFIDLQGKIESVPLLDYALNEASLKIHEATIDVTRKNKLVSQLYKELSRRVSDKNLSEGNSMAIDAVRGQIWDKYEIYIPLHIDSKKTKMEKAEFFLKGFTDDEYIERTVKFGFNELQAIKDLLDSMPEGFAKHVRSITKKQDPRFNIETFRTGEIRGGCFENKTGKIVLSLPVESPARLLENKFNLDYAAAKKQETKKRLKKEFIDSELHNALFQHVLMHEIAESMFPHMGSEWKNKWFAIEDIPKDIAGKEDWYFLTQYGKKNPREDFCETFAAYIVHGTDFRAFAEKHPHIKKKYDFMQELFSGDGRKREFENRTQATLRMLHQDPRNTFEQIMIESMIRDTIKDDELAAEERERFIGRVMSYEDVEEIMAEHEEEGTETSREKAAKILQKREFESEQFEELQRLDLLCRRLINAATIAVYKAGAAPDIAYQIPQIIHDEGEAGAVRLLAENGATKEKADECVKRLSGLYEAFPEAYEMLIADAEESEQDITGIVQELTKYIKHIPPEDESLSGS